jgi:NADH:ubiquinone oxidoreductase subunit E
MRQRTVAVISGLFVALCVAILLADYLVASIRAPREDRLVKNLQQQTRSDAQWAPKLASEQKRITAARLARKQRDNAVAWVLIAAAALFLTFARNGRRASARAGLKPRVSVVGQSLSLANPKPSPAELDLSYVDTIVAQLGRDKEATIPLLQAIQTHYRYLPDEALHRLCELTAITPAEIAGTSSFYARFRRSPVGEHVVRVCHGTACHVSGARQITDELRRYLAIPEGADTDAARMFTLDEVACLGCCSLAPMLIVDGHPAGKLTPATACDALKPFERQPKGAVA